MQNKDLLFWILNIEKKPQYQNNAGNVEVGEGVTKTDGTPAHLKSSPDKWKDIVINWARNNKYLGLFRDFSIGLKFVNDGAKILRTAKWNIGMEAINYLSITKLDRTTFPDKYNHWYTGEFDFSKYKQTDTGVEIDIVEGGLSKLLKANEGIVYEIPINTDEDRFSVYLDGLTFENNVEMDIYKQSILGNSFVGGGNFSCAGMGIISIEGTSQGVVSNDESLTVNEEPKQSNCFFQSFTKTGILNVSGFFNYQIYDTGFASSNVQIKAAIRKSTNKGVFIAEYVIIPLTTLNRNDRAFQQYSFTIPFEPDTIFTLYVETPGATLLHTTYPIISGSLKYNYDVRFDPTLCEAISWYRLFERLVDKMTGGKYTVQSNFLKTLTDQCVTSGQAIRQYQSVSVIKTSINEFFQACRRWGVGLSIKNNMLVIEKHPYFFKNDIVYHLGEIKDILIEDANDLMINTIKTGYKNQTYDNVNGKDEFNVTQGYTTPITRVVKELDITSPYRADMNGIELTRLKLFGKDTTDNSADNETFQMNVTKGTNYDYWRGNFTTEINGGQYYLLIPSVLFALDAGKQFTFSGGTFTVVNTSYLIAGSTYIKVAEPVTNASFNESISIYDSNVYKLNRPSFSAISGLHHPTEAFNVLLSPKDGLLNNAAYISSLMDLEDAGKIVFQTGEKNSKLSRSLDGITVTEDADINIAALGPKLFKPYYFKFKTQVDIAIPDIIKNNPYSKISFDYLGNTYSGFMWDISIAVSNDVQEWQLLSSPENNMKNLI